MASIFSCWWWWLLLGALLGWLASWWLSRNAHKQAHASWTGRLSEYEGRHAASLRQKDTEIAKLAGDFNQMKARPMPAAEVKTVEKIVEKIVEKPVDRVVEKVVHVDNPSHLGRIRALEAEVAMIAGLRSQISSLQSAPPKIVEKIVDRPVDRIIEKIVDRPVDRVVEKIVEKPVDRIVEKVIEKPVDRIVEKEVTVHVDNPRHLIRIRELESEVGLIAGLRTQLLSLQSAPPKIVEKIVDRPVERIVEKIVDRPVERIVEKIVDRPVDRVVEKIVNVDNPSHLNRIRTLEAEVAMIAGLRSQINALQSAPPKIVEKIIDRPVEKIVEKIVDRPVEKIVEKIVDRPVDRIVEKIVDRPVDRIVEKVVEKIVDRPVDRVVEKIVNVDNPSHLSRIRSLEAEVALIAGLRSQINTLQSAPPKIVEKIVDRPVERIVEKIVDRPVDRVVEKLVPDIRGIEERDRQLRELRARLETLERERNATVAQRDEEIRQLRSTAPAKVDNAAATAAGFKVRGMDDLEVVEGIGPKIAGLLNADGCFYFSELAKMTPAQIQVILDKAGPRFRLAKPDTWPQQADLAAKNRWADLRKLQDELTAGNRK